MLEPIPSAAKAAEVAVAISACMYVCRTPPYVVGRFDCRATHSEGKIQARHSEGKFRKQSELQTPLTRRTGRWIYTCRYMFTHMHTHVQMHVCVCVHIRDTYTHMHIYICMYVHMCMWTCMYVHLHMYMYMRMCEVHPRQTDGIA